MALSTSLLEGALLEARPALLVAVFVAACLLMHWIMERHGEDEEEEDLPEPPVVPTTIPYIGLVYGLFTMKLSYLRSVKSKSSSGINTIALPWCQRMYIVTDLHIFQEVQKKSKTTSFAAIASQVCAKLGGFSPKTSEMMVSNASRANPYAASLYKQMTHSVQASVAPGTAFATIIEALEDEMSALACIVQQRADERMPLFAWLRQHVTLMLTNMVYGSHNPFKDPAISNAFWDFDEATLALLGIPDILQPYLTCQGYRSRERFVAAFADYLRQGHFQSASEAVQHRHSFMNAHQISLEDQARSELINCMAVLENVIPAAFWTIYNTITRPELLSSARLAAQKYVSLHAAGKEKKNISFHLSTIRSEPVLFALASETVRCVGNSHEARLIQHEDLVLSSRRFRLRENGLVLWPSRCAHMDEALFGPGDPAVFDHTRFLRKTSGGEEAAFTPRGYLGFGSGETLCPGRHLALSAVIGVLALFIVQYDVEEVAESESSAAPLGMVFKPTSLSFAHPDRELHVRLRKRQA